MKPLRWLLARWRTVAALVAVAVAYLLGRRRSQPVERQAGVAEGRAREVAENLHGQAADLRGELEAAHVRDAAADAAIEEAAREAAARDVPPGEVPRIKSVEPYL